MKIGKSEQEEEEAAAPGKDCGETFCSSFTFTNPSQRVRDEKKQKLISW